MDKQSFLSGSWLLFSPLREGGGGVGEKDARKKLLLMCTHGVYDTVTYFCNLPTFNDSIIDII